VFFPQFWWRKIWILPLFLTMCSWPSKRKKWGIYSPILLHCKLSPFLPPPTIWAILLMSFIIFLFYCIIIIIITIITIIIIIIIIIILFFLYEFDLEGLHSPLLTKIPSSKFKQYTCSGEYMRVCLFNLQFSLPRLFFYLWVPPQYSY
jgi:hypothetical protein